MDNAQGGGTLQAVGALIFNGSSSRTVTSMDAYVIQVGSGSGNFQMAILHPTGVSTASVVAVTNTVTTITGGINTLSLTSPFTLLANTTYYLAVYNQVASSTIAAVLAGAGPNSAPPINFRVQNIPGFTVAQVISTSDVTLGLSPWLAVS